MTVRTRWLSVQRIWLARVCISLWVFMLTVWAFSGISTMLASVERGQTIASLHSTDSAQIGATRTQLPLSFIPNAGQTDSAVRFHVKGTGHTIFFTPSEVVFSAARQLEDESVLSSVVRLRFAGANPNPRVEGLEPLPGIANFFLGNDPARWRTDVPTYGAVAYRELYPGIDLVYRGSEGTLKSEFLVAPGADAELIRLEYSGVEALRLREDGALVLQTGLGELIEEVPLIYQEAEGRRRRVEGGYRLLENGQVGFALGTYDASYPLVIDPTLSYSTYLGASSSDRGLSIAVDISGNAYVTGITFSTDFTTTTGALDESHNGSFDAFVTKLNAAGSALSYSTYLGGSSLDIGNGIAVDNSGNAYVTGQTRSIDFPTAAPIQGTHGDGGTNNDAFVTKLNATGSALIYSTYLGGNSSDIGNGIAVDDSGNAYVTGSTSSTNFPTESPFQSANAGGTDVFVTKLNTMGTAYIYSTYLGGGGTDHGRDIAVDSASNAYVTGQTRSSNFPTVSPVQVANAGGDDGFVTKFNAAGSALVYSTYLGGSFGDDSTGIAVDGAGNAYVTGSTLSTDFPTTTGAFDESHNGSNDAFVTRLNAAGSAHTYSTYLGGSSTDIGRSIAVASDTAFVTGETGSTDFPTESPFQGANAGGTRDVFLIQLDAAGSTLLYSTYLGGDAGDLGNGIAVNSTVTSLNAYVVGETMSGNFPTANALQPTIGGSLDAFMANVCFMLRTDVDDNGAVDVDDINSVAIRWRLTAANPDPDGNPATPNYEDRFDLDGDEIITVRDMQLVAADWGRTC